MAGFFIPIMRNKLVASLAVLACHFGPVANATGIQPDSTIVMLSAGDGQAQMAVKNTEAVPLLMNAKVIDLPGSENLTVVPLPEVTRVEANGRQIVRFALTKTTGEITKQVLKRVSFEGIPPKNTDPEKSVVTINVRQTIPMVISPKGLVQDPEPWKKLKIFAAPDGLQVVNDSPFVVRLKADAKVLPADVDVRLLQDTYILPGASAKAELPKDVQAKDVQAVKIFPASPWGFAVEPYDIAISKAK